MTILLNPWADLDQWRDAFEREFPDRKIETWPDVADPEAVRIAVISSEAATDLDRFPNLEAILALSAGVEYLRKIELPDGPVVRLLDDSMSNEMASYALHWVSHFQKRYDAYVEHQAKSRWQHLDYTPAGRFPVGILGYGSIGRLVGARFRSLDFPINAWSRTPRTEPDVTSYAGQDQLKDFLSSSKAIVNILPHTPQTRGLMDAERFGQMRKGAIYLSMGRGATTDTEAVLGAVHSGHLSAAILDVTFPEPLPEDSPLWNHPRIRITPHVSGYTQVNTAFPMIAANIRRIDRGEQPFPLFDSERGY